MLVRGILYILVFLLCLTVFAKARSRRVRQIVLLLGSYVLYCSWGAWFAGVLLASTVINFLLAEWLRRKPVRLVLAIGVLFNLAVLCTFKYLPEAAVSFPFSSLQRFSHLALPLGLSFWTFQAMSFLFDLYRGEELDPSFVEFASYMAFFPVTISGPICRMPDMLPQFRADKVTTLNEIGGGCARIATGLLMMQLARLLGQGILSGDGINRGFDHVARWSGTDVWCLTFGFALQLFLDFAGYSHIAIGAAQALGFTVPENFAHPFQSTTPSIFWTRWHMSLSFWIRDYVFLPLAPLRREIWWRYLTLIFAMVLFGLWHRASLLFLLWGCYHGVLLVLHRQWQALQKRWSWSSPSAIGTTLSWTTTAALISLGWIFFRANSLPQAGQMWSAVFSPAHYASHFLSGSLYLMVFILAAGYCVVLWINDALNRSMAVPATRASSAIVHAIARTRWYWLPPIYTLALIVSLIVTHSQSAGAAQFMYRQF